MIWLPSTEQIIYAHSRLIARTGGSDGIRDRGLVESALMRAYAGFAGDERYPSIEEKAAAVGCGLISNHGFIDGNKRIGVTTMLLILRENNIALNYSQQELINLGLGLAEGKADVEDCVQWILNHK